MRAGGGPARPGLRVLATGPLCTVQDLGRVGYAHLGVGTAGAADRGALRLANRLVGNDVGAAGLEVTLGGLAVRAEGAVTVAVAGAPCPVTLAGCGTTRAALHSVLRIADRTVLRLGVPDVGLRTYVAVRGGVGVEPVLGSRSTDVFAGIGPAVPVRDDLLPIGRPSAWWPRIDAAPVASPLSAEVWLRVLPGPREDWFTTDAVRGLFERPYRVEADSDRVGMRLRGPPLERTFEGELPSEGMVRGSLQVPPSGQPTLLLAEHPVTGGYPVVGVVVDADTDKAAQVRPGQEVRFVRGRSRLATEYG